MSSNWRHNADGLEGENRGKPTPILLRQIAKDIGLALDEFLKHRLQLAVKTDAGPNSG